MPLELPPARRVVTGFDSGGRSAFLEDAPLPVRTNPKRPGHYSSVVWATGPLPVPVNDSDRAAEVRGIMPPAGGSLLRIVDMPPEPKDPEAREHYYAEERKRISQAGVSAEHGVKRHPEARHPGMHITDTIDYAIVLSGEVYAVMEEGEKLLKAGDVLIQRGGVHAWSNRSDEYCRMAFVMLAAAR